MRQKYSTTGLIVKCVVLFFLVIFITSMISMLWETYVDDVAWESDEARILGYCETDLREKEYGELWDYMELYNLKGERYEVYWNAVNHRLDEIQYEQWKRAAELEMDGADEMLRQYEKKLGR